MPDHPQKPQWNTLAAKLLNGKSPDSLNWMTPEGILVKPLYTAEDLEGMEHVNTLPGLPPYVRGPVATMYAGASSSVSGMSMPASNTPLRLPST